MLLPFRNVTRRPEQDWLEAGAALMLAQTLGRFNDINVVPEERTTAARRRLGIPVAAAPDETQLRALAGETGGWTAVSGDVFAIGDSVRVAVRALDVVSSRVLMRAEAMFAATADPRSTFDNLSIRLLEPAGVTATGTTSLAALTTQSADAFRSYARGVDLYQRGLFRPAEAEFTTAVRLDPEFALAWSGLAAASTNTGGVSAIMNPMSTPYRAMQQAARLAGRLPHRDAELIRAVSAVFRGEMRRARRQLDSLFAADPNNLDVAYWLAMTHLMAPPVDTSVSPARLLSDPNRAVALARHILERDPRNLIAYQAPVIAYGLGGGLLWGDIFGFARDFSSFGAALMAVPDARAVPVVEAGAIRLVPRREFDSLPAAERQTMRRRSADAAWEWVERWLLAGPDDAQAHAYAARIAELREDYGRALLEVLVADSLGIQSAIENIPGWKLSLLLLSGRPGEAAAMADSMLAAGTLTNSPFLRAFDRRRAYGAAALLLGRRWSRAATMAEMMGPPSATDRACASLRREMVAFDPVLPLRIRQMVMDTVVAHLQELRANPTLAPCEGQLSTGIQP